MPAVAVEAPAPTRPVPKSHHFFFSASAWARLASAAAAFAPFCISWYHREPARPSESKAIAPCICCCSRPMRAPRASRALASASCWADRSPWRICPARLPICPVAAICSCAASSAERPAASMRIWAPCCCAMRCATSWLAAPPDTLAACCAAACEACERPRFICARARLGPVPSAMACQRPCASTISPRACCPCAASPAACCCAAASRLARSERHRAVSSALPP